MTIRSNISGARFGEFQRSINNQYDRTLERITTTLDQVLGDGEEMIHHIIDTRGVKNTVPNSDGRNKSGRMNRAVTHRTIRRGDKITGQVGWVPTGDYEKYFSYQEDGTLNKGKPQGAVKPEGSAPRGIRPMLAIREVHDYVQEELNNRLGRRRG